MCFLLIMTDTLTAQENGNHLYIHIVLDHLQNASNSCCLNFTDLCEVERIVVMFQMGKLRLWRYSAPLVYLKKKKEKVKIVTRALYLDSLNSVLMRVCVCVCVCVHVWDREREDSEGTKIESGTSESLEALNFYL